MELLLRNHTDATKAIEVANFLLYLSEKKKAPLSNMKLQKMIYFAEGLFLAKYDKSLINEYIAAWEYGPVVASVYHHFKYYGNKNIPFSGSSGIKLKSEEKAFLEYIFVLLKEYDAITLYKLTHIDGTPWKSIHTYFDGRIPRGKVIEMDEIKNYFRKTFKING